MINWMKRRGGARRRQVTKVQVFPLIGRDVPAVLATSPDCPIMATS